MSALGKRGIAMLRRKSNPPIPAVLLACVGALAASGAQLGESKNMPEKSALLVVSVEFTRLIERHLPALKLAERTVTDAGLLYRFTCSKPGERLSAVIAVYADEPLASAAVQYQTGRTSVGPSQTETSIHHDLVLWKAGDDPASGSLLLRSANVVVRFFGDLPWSVRLHLMEQIDQALQSGGPEVTHAKEVHPPEIVNVKLPGHISPGSRVEAEIEVANIAPADALFGAGNSNVLVSGGPKPMLAYYAPPQPAHQNIVLIIATPGNLLSTKTIPVEVK
jgi:hypothetical protein